MYELMTSAVYGKTMENLKTLVNFELVDIYE